MSEIKRKLDEEKRLWLEQMHEVVWSYHPTVIASFLYSPRLDKHIQIAIGEGWNEGL